MVTEVFPGIRSMIARKLVEKHGLSQKAAAERLGTTQPAISQYKREIRGSNMQYLESEPEVIQIIDSLAEKTSTGRLSHEEICGEFCRICKKMRSAGLICDLHKRTYPHLEGCRSCMD